MDCGKAFLRTCLLTCINEGNFDMLDESFFDMTFQVSLLENDLYLPPSTLQLYDIATDVGKSGKVAISHCHQLIRFQRLRTSLVSATVDFLNVHRKRLESFNFRMYDISASADVRNLIKLINLLNGGPYAEAQAFLRHNFNDIISENVLRTSPIGATFLDE